ncbi:MAG TPA: helix-turn-helix domain-containing protein [Polyangiaceae bacterium]|nr:helix-turn-helix domain-containing protein [Polyangiaceae bacterium]
MNGRSKESGEFIDYRALAELRHQIRRFLTFSEQEARAAGVEPQQHQVLLAVKGLPEGARPTVSTLAERLKLRHHTVVGLLDRLTAAKLAVRRPSAHDGREILVELTQKGERVLRALSMSHQSELRNAAPALLTSLAAIVGEQHTLRDTAGGQEATPATNRT